MQWDSLKTKVENIKEVNRHGEEDKKPYTSNWSHKGKERKNKKEAIFTVIMLRISRIDKI